MRLVRWGGYEKPSRLRVGHVSGHSGGWMDLRVVALLDGGGWVGGSTGQHRLLEPRPDNQVGGWGK